MLQYLQKFNSPIKTIDYSQFHQSIKSKEWSISQSMYFVVAQNPRIKKNSNVSALLWK